MRSQSPLRPLLVLCHPLWMASLVVLLLNDHYLKRAGILPNAVTGKLSDIAGMLVAPALLAVVFGVRTRRGLLTAHLVLGLGFTCFELWSLPNDLLATLYRRFGYTWTSYADLTDLLALALLPLGYVWSVRVSEAPQAVRPALGRALGMAGMMASVATSAEDDDGSMPPTVCDFDCDMDGYDAPEDCNDNDPTVFPGQGCGDRVGERICDDGDDDDGDSLVDCNDPDCQLACADITEVCLYPGVTDVVATPTLMGDTRGGSSVMESACGGADAPEAVFILSAPVLGELTLVPPPGHHLSVRSNCVDLGTELGCESASDAEPVPLVLTLEPSVNVTLIVDADDGLLAGPFSIDLVFEPFGCGDGVMTYPEACDDGNQEAGDGCSPTCTFEPEGACAAATVFEASPTPGVLSEGTMGFVSSCGGSALSYERAFLYTPTTTGVVLFTAQGAINLSLSARATCSDVATELGCANSTALPGATEALAVDVVEGVPITLFVEAVDPSIDDTFVLTATPQ